MSIQRIRGRGSMVFVAGALAVVSCKGGAEAPSKPVAVDPAKAPSAPAGPVGPSPGEASAAPEVLRTASGRVDDTGPVPPEASMVFFVAEGALVPLACFDAKSKKVQVGAPCLALAAEGEEARVIASELSADKKLGALAEPLCTAGDGAKTARAVEGLEAGAKFEWGVWPKAAAKLVQPVTTPREVPKVTAEERTRLASAVAQALKLPSVAPESLVVEQRVAVELDGVGPQESVYAVVVPADDGGEKRKFSGVWLVAGEAAPVLIERSKNGEEVFEVRGTVDLEGDGRRELWLRARFAEGAGDALFRSARGTTLERLAPYTCGT